MRDIIKSQVIASGAFHDAMLAAQRIPTAMLFIPNIGNRTHSPDKDSAEAQIKIGAQVFATAVIRRTLPALDVST